MADTEIALDTSAYAAFKMGRTEAVAIVRRATRVSICSVVLGELLSGFAVGSREEKNRLELQQFLSSDRVIILDDITADYYASVYRGQRLLGRPIRTNDMWIAASALQHDQALYSHDRHFKDMERLVVGTTLADFQLDDPDT